MDNGGRCNYKPLGAGPRRHRPGKLYRLPAAPGLLTQQEAQSIQEGLLLLLEEQVQRLTQGESSSLPAQRAEELMDGIGYCVDFYLQSLPTLEEALEFIDDDELVEITPKSIRMRKRILGTEARKKIEARKKNA